jgi:hypothetical protein
MVSDTANIAAHKLDIESLFEEINDSTNTIKSSRIYIDDASQTLDLVFKVLVERLDGYDSTFTSQGTQISAIQGNINSKIWQQDIVTATDPIQTKTNTLTNQYTELEQEVDSISLTVQTHSSQISEKADNSSLTTVSDKVTSLETSLEGFQTTVSQTYATKTEASAAQTAADNAQSDANGLKTRVSTAETKITQNTTEIGLRATKAELANYSTTDQMNSAIQLKADGITSAVSSTYVSKTQFNNLSTDTEKAQTTASNAQETATKADTLVQQLADSISMLVTDGNGTSLMTQTENGWTFSTADIQTSINAASETLSDLTAELGDTASAVDVLQQAVADLGEMAEYVKISTYEDEPCIELGEGDSDFKLLITNTRIMFTEGGNVPAYITNQSLHIQKAVVEEELQQGGFVWKSRDNGNLGLVWKGIVEKVIVNILPNMGKTSTSNGITFTVRSDGSVLVSGTATAEATFGMYYGTFDFEVGKTYYLTGCPAGGGTSTYQLMWDWKNEDNVWAGRYDTGTGASSYECNIAYTSSNCMFRIRVYPNAVVDNVVFYPMLSTYPDAEYAPYGAAVRR